MRSDYRLFDRGDLRFYDTGGNYVVVNRFLQIGTIHDDWFYYPFSSRSSFEFDWTDDGIAKLYRWCDGRYQSMLSHVRTSDYATFYRKLYFKFRNCGRDFMIVVKDHGGFAARQLVGGEFKLVADSYCDHKVDYLLRLFK